VLEKIWRTYVQLFDRVVTENNRDFALYETRMAAMESVY